MKQEQRINLLVLHSTSKACFDLIMTSKGSITSWHSIRQCRLSICSLAYICLLLGGQLSVLAQKSQEGGSLSAAYDALKQKNHKKALELFNAAAREFPDSAQAHYGRAMALKELGRKDEAKKEFKLTLLLNAPEDVIKNCKEKIYILEGSKSEANAPNSAIFTQAPQTVRPQDVESSINRILKQSEEKIRSVKSNSDAYADRIYNNRADAHSKLMEQARQEADEMRRARMIFGRRAVPMFSDAEIMQRQAEAQFKSASALERAKADYEARRQESQARALSIKESAEGLESQMINKPSESSGIFLIPHGTNLYVRNYGHFDPVLPEPPEPLHAVPLKMPQLMNKNIRSSAQKNPTDSKSTASPETGDNSI